MYNYFINLWKSFFCNDYPQIDTNLQEHEEIDKLLLLYDLPLGRVLMSLND